MVKPTVGANVLFVPANPNHDSILRSAGQKLAAIIASVHSDTMVNLAVFDANGAATCRTSVTLIQDADPIPSGSYCVLHNYEVQQAALAAAAKAKLAAGAEASPAPAQAAGTSQETATKATGAAPEKS